MDRKALFAFFLLFLLVLTFGCIGETKEEKKNNPGILNATILINGIESNKIDLVSYQNAQVGVKIINHGTEKITNVTGRLLGCLDTNDARVDEILPNTQKYMSWSVKAPELGQGEKINCPTTIRLCFDYTSKGYTDLVFLPENYADVPPVGSSTSAGDFLKFDYAFGTNRVTNEGNNEFSGNIYLRNVGPGWVDYATYSDGLAMNTIKNITITIIGDNIEIIKFGDLNQSTLNNNGWLSDDNKNITISTDNIGNYKYLLKLVQGKELFFKMSMNVTNPSEFQDSTKIYNLKTEANYGYCIDIATIDTTLKGR